MSKTILVITSLVAFFLAEPTASADSLRTPMRPVQIELGGEFNAGGGERTVGVRGYVGYAHALARLSPQWQLYASAGLHAHIGQAYVDDRRAVDDLVLIDRRLVGPEVRLGFALGSYAPSLYTYVGAGVFQAQAESISDNLAEAGGGYGYRVSLGAAYRGSWYKIAESMDDDDDEDGAGAMAMLGFLLPNSIELTVEQVDGDGPRFGGGVGWAF